MGLANGLAVMRDEESRSLWDHITGECFEGPLAGQRLDFWHVSLTTVLAELTRYPTTILLKSDHRSLTKTIINQAIGGLSTKHSFINKEKTMLVPHFRMSMNQAIDGRLPEGEQGLGLMDDDDNGKFYPMRLIPNEGRLEDVWQGRPLYIERGPIDGVPFATWADTGEMPMQLLSRWYGFSFTYPHCEIYERVGELVT